MIRYNDAGDLMAAYPGRPFKLVELIRHVSRGRTLTAKERPKYERGIQRAMRTLSEHGLVEIVKPEPGKYGDKYIWRIPGQMLSNDNNRPHIR